MTAVPQPVALVVDDHPEVHETVALCLDRLGHNMVKAMTCADAETALTEHSFTYAIIDLDLPMREGGVEALDNGLHLLGKVKKLHAGLPLIIITGHACDSQLVRRAMRGHRGWTEFLNKPFAAYGADGSLDAAIEEMMKELAEAERQEQAEAEPTDGIRDGDPLVFFPDRVEMRGVHLADGPNDQSGTIRLILDLLRTEPGLPPASYSGENLAMSVGVSDNAVRLAIGNFRSTAERRLRHHGIACDTEPIIKTRDSIYPGYHLDPRLVCQDGAAEAVPRVPERASFPTGEIGERLAWVLDQAANGGVRLRDYRSKWGMSEKTFERDRSRIEELGFRLTKSGTHAKAILWKDDRSREVHGDSGLC